MLSEESDEEEGSLVLLRRPLPWLSREAADDMESLLIAGNFPFGEITVFPFSNRPNRCYSYAQLVQVHPFTDRHKCEDKRRGTLTLLVSLSQ